MKQPKFKPKFHRDGTLDPECLQEAGLGWVKQWLTSRLSGDDPYFPIDRRVDEDPEGLIVGILRESGAADPASDLISRGLLALLDTARKTAPEIPPYFNNVLRLCQRIPVAQTSSWFAEELSQLARVPRKTEERWGGYERAKEIAMAGTVQAPGLPSAASRDTWLALMKIPRYATLSLLGLGRSLHDQVVHLEAWWDSCLVDERDAELNQIIFMGLKTNPEDELISMLASIGSDFPEDLKDSIDIALRRNGARPCFADAQARPTGQFPISGAIFEAGYLLEYLNLSDPVR